MHERGGERCEKKLGFVLIDFEVGCFSFFKFVTLKQDVCVCHVH